MPQPVAPGYPLAGWGSRVAAALIDGFIIGVPSTVVFLVVFLVVLGGAGLSGGEEEAAVAAIAGIAISMLVLFAVLLVLTLLYAPLTMARTGERNGQTIGKQLIRVRVVRTDGQPVTVGTGMFREILVKLLLFGGLGSFLFSIPTILDYLWPLWDDQHRALHDMVASTLVVTA